MREITKYLTCILISILLAQTAKGQGDSVQRKFYAFGGIDWGFGWLDFSYIDDAVQGVNSHYNKTELGSGFCYNVGVGYKNKFQLEYRKSLGRGGHDIIEQVMVNTSRGFENQTIEELQYSFQEFLAKGSFLKESRYSLFFIAGYNNSRVERTKKAEGFKGGGFTLGLEFAFQNKHQGFFAMESVSIKRSTQKFSPTSPSFFGAQNFSDTYSGSYWFLQFSLKLGGRFL